MTKQVQSTSQRQMPAAHLTRTMQLLEKTCADLDSELSTEINDNPALEMVDESRCPDCKRIISSFPCQICVSRENGSGPIVYVAPRNTSDYRPAVGDEYYSSDNGLRTPESLADHVLKQVAPSLTENERAVADYILARLDEHGLLLDHPAEIAAYLRVRLSAVKHILGQLRRADPVGVGSQNVSECLLTQLEMLEKDGQVHPLAHALLTEFWEHLARRDFVTIARRRHVSVETVSAAAQFIKRNLSPYPSQAHWNNNEAAGGRYFRPDVEVNQSPHTADGPLVVQVFTAARGWLRVNPSVRNIIKQIEEPEKKDEWASYLERAALFVKCMRQRDNAMRRIVRLIVKRQPAFILGGDSDLIPMTRAELAEELDLHESTISRAVAGKTIALPSGHIIPLARFFDRSLAVRAAVRKIIEHEDSAMTDEQVAAQLVECGYKVARRTVAKYRSMLGILPANLRARQLPRAA
jgi:RNA polymerase sigma-54 factor